MKFLRESALKSTIANCCVLINTLQFAIIDLSSFDAEIALKIFETEH